MSERKSLFALCRFQWVKRHFCRYISRLFGCSILSLLLVTQPTGGVAVIIAALNAHFQQMSYSFMRQSVLRQVRSIFRSEFFTVRDLVLPFSVSVPPPFLKVIQWLLTSSSSPSRQFYPSFAFSSKTCFRRPDQVSLPSSRRM